MSRIQGVLRVAAVIGGGTAIVAAIIVNRSIGLLGFPDGHVTAYDHATVPPHRLFCVWSAIAGTALLLFGVQRHRPISRAAAVIAALYLVAAFVTFVVVDDWYLARYLRLDAGAGG